MTEKHINSFIMYGNPGVGKTTIAAKVMHDALWIVTRKSNLGGYHSWLEQNPAEAAELGCKPVKACIEVPRMLADKATGEMTPNDVESVIRSYVKEYVRKTLNDETKVHGIVFDELSVFCDWVYARMSARTRNGFEVFKEIGNWVSEMCDISTVTQLPMAFLCHSKDPSTYDDGPYKGQLKHLGGPSMPAGSLITRVCGAADAVFQVAVETTATGEKRRVIRTDTDPQWERKCRVHGVPAVLEPDLRPLLTQAGWNFNQQDKG